MKVLFLALGDYTSVKNRGIYLDLLREFISDGHEVYIVTTLKPGTGERCKLIEEEGSRLLKVQAGRITKTNPIEKGINMLLIERRYIRAIETHFPGVRFDLVLYPTPPITFLKVVEYIRKRDGAKSYLMLKDIFPQNAVDIGMMGKTGLKGIIYRHFRKKEKKLYRISDHIGCMSQANVDYLLQHNPELDPRKVEICPNSTDVTDTSMDAEARQAIREKYGIPAGKTVFVYGGNLGKPQGIPFLIDCLKAVKDFSDACFLVIGNGTEYKKLESYKNTSGQENFILMKRIPREDYEAMVGACDVGMIFLDHRFTIPNFPSRLLSYMQAKLPVLACTDPNTDIGKVITEGGFGWWCESNDAAAFAGKVREILDTDTAPMKDTEFRYLQEHYTSREAYSIIMNSISLE